MLISDRSLLAVAVVVLAVAACAQPGVIEVAPGKAIVGTGGAQLAMSGTGGGGATGGASGTGVAGNTMATGGAGAAGNTMGSGGNGVGGTTVGSGGMGAGGSTAGTGGMGGAGTGGMGGAGTGGAGASGAGGAVALPACPSGWTCEDPMKQLTDLGAEGTVTDPSGAPIKYSCGNGGAVECDMANPKGSCPELPNAFCAHVMVGGLLAADLYSCAQLCTP